MVQVKIQKINSDIQHLSYAKEGDAGLDLRSAEEKTIKAGDKEIIKTGIKMAIPQGFVGLIWDRSGMAAKHSIKSMGGVIDSGYRGEVGVILHNLGKTDFKVEKNMRVAQMLFQPVHSATLEHVEELDETDRGEGGFGHTGTK
ncbi:dUTP diphosphatase [Candidatus Woesearchaeota archaeon]|nr:dUTP diphosphatase [Candidatus Woesearchaeota archaeon]MBT6519274.1 dUTP diphosphatase [Candidatus Woesearchaeota archaeon]MBT7368466.1 dUTP diphosphatase [Candidatus Woesearchaeota archaeon]